MESVERELLLTAPTINLIYRLNCVILLTILLAVPYNVLQAYFLIIQPHLFASYDHYVAFFLMCGYLNIIWTVVSGFTIISIHTEWQWPFLLNAMINGVKIIFNLFAINCFNIWFQIIAILLSVILEFALCYRIKLLQPISHRNYIIYT